MTLEDFFNQPVIQEKEKLTEKEKIEKKREPKGTLAVSEGERKEKGKLLPETIRNTALYKGRLDYIQEILLKDCSDIEAEVLAERLDVPLKVAKLLLEDCKKK